MHEKLEMDTQTNETDQDVIYAELTHALSVKTQELEEYERNVQLSTRKQLDDMQKVVDAKHQEYAELLVKNTELETRRNIAINREEKAHKELEICKLELGKVEKRNADLVEKYTTSQKEIAALQDKCQQLELQVRAMEASLDTKISMATQEYRRRIEELTKQLREQAVASDARIASMHTDVEREKLAVLQITEQRGKDSEYYRAKISKLQQNTQNLEQSYSEKMRQQTEEHTAEKRDLSERLDKLRMELSEAQKENVYLNNVVSTPYANEQFTKKMREIKEECSNSLRKHREEISQFRTNNSNLEHSLRVAEMASLEREKKIIKLQAKISVMTTEMRAELQEIVRDELEKKMRSDYDVLMEEQRISCDNELGILRSEIKGLQDALERSKHTSQIFDARCGDLQSKLRVVTEHATSLEQEVHKLNEIRTSILKGNEELQEQNRIILNDNEKIRREYMQLQHSFDETHQKLEKSLRDSFASGKHADISEQNLHETCTKLATTQQDLATKCAQLADNQAELVHAKAKYESERQRNSVIQNRMELAESQLGSARRELDECMARANELSKMLKIERNTLHQERQEHISIVRESESLHQQFEQSTQKLQEMQSEVIKAHDQLRMEKQRCSLLQREVAQLEGTSNARVVDLEEQLSALRDNKTEQVGGALARANLAEGECVRLKSIITKVEQRYTIQVAKSQEEIGKLRTQLAKLQSELAHLRSA